MGPKEDRCRPYDQQPSKLPYNLTFSFSHIITLLLFIICIASIIAADHETPANPQEYQRPARTRLPFPPTPSLTPSPKESRTSAPSVQKKNSRTFRLTLHGRRKWHQTSDPVRFHRIPPERRISPPMHDRCWGHHLSQSSVPLSSAVLCIPSSVFDL